MSFSRRSKRSYSGSPGIPATSYELVQASLCVSMHRRRLIEATKLRKSMKYHEIHLFSGLASPWTSCKAPCTALRITDLTAVIWVHFEGVKPCLGSLSSKSVRLALGADRGARLSSLKAKKWCSEGFTCPQVQVVLGRI